MTRYIIMCRSLTYAQRSARLLERNGISAVVAKGPKGASENGCSYGVRVRYERLDMAQNILKNAGLNPGKVFEVEDNGDAREVKA